MYAYDTQSPWTRVTEHPLVKWQNIAFPSAILQAQCGYTAAYPADYDETTDRLPVVVFLHGKGGQNSLMWTPVALPLLGEWFSTGLRCIAVFPCGPDYSMWGDNAAGTMPVESYVLKELLPQIHAVLRTDGRTGLVGFSMGAFGALSLASGNPVTFMFGFGYGAPLYTDQLSSRDVQDWAPYFVSKTEDDVYTADEMAAYFDKTPNGRAKPGLTLRAVWGASDPTYNVGALRYFADLKARGATCETRTRLPGGKHTPASYFTVEPEMRMLGHRIRECFEGRSTRGIYCLDNSRYQEGSDPDDRDANIVGLSSVPFVTGFAWRCPWNKLGDFSRITRVMAKMDAEDPDGKLKLSILIANTSDDGQDAGEPEDIFLNAPEDMQWVSPNGPRCVPWYPVLQSEWAKMATALGDFQVWDVVQQAMVPLRDHSRIGRISINPPGNGPMRNANSPFEIPGFTWELFSEAALSAFKAMKASFPSTRVGMTLNHMEDDRGDFSGYMLDRMLDELGPDFELFHDALAGNRNRPTSAFIGRPPVNFVPEIYRASQGYTGIVMQALTPYFNSDHPKVQNAKVWEAVEYALNTFNCRTVELYVGDIHNPENVEPLSQLAARMR